MKPVVIKLGGSLQDSAALAAWLDEIVRHGRGQAVVVPGGGRYAESVRIAQAQQGFGDDSAHRQAIEAMLKSADDIINLAPHLKLARSIDQIPPIIAAGDIPVAVAIDDWLQADEIQASWNWTSDSLALWLARKLDAERMLLVKSVAPGNEPIDVRQAAEQGLVDKAFPSLMNACGLDVGWAGPDQAGELATWLRDPHSQVFCGILPSGTDRGSEYRSGCA